MKTKILTATLLMALSVSAWAQDAAPAGSDKPTPTPEGPKRTERQAPAEKREFVDNDGKKNDLILLEKGGKVLAVVTPVDCVDGTSCMTTTLLDKRITDPFADIEAALRKSLADKKDTRAGRERIGRDENERRVSKRNERAEESSVKEFREEFRDELEDALMSECRIDLERTKSKRSYEVSAQDTLSKSLVGTRFANIELPKQNEQAQCAGRTLSDFMAEKEDEMLELEVDQESVADLRREIKDLKRDLKKAKNPAEREKIQKELADAEAEFTAVKKEADDNRKKIQVADTELKNFFDGYLMKEAVKDIAASPNAQLTYLHDLASGTPEIFGGIRKSASNALLSVYKLQAQSQLALKDAANRTQDGNLKLQYSEAANAFLNNGKAFNSNMLSNGTREEMYQNAYTAHLNSMAVNPKRPTFDEVRDAQSYANGVVSDIYSNYTSGASQITNYITSDASGVVGINGRTGTQVGSVGVGSSTGMPQILADGTIAGVNTGLNSTIGGMNTGNVRAVRQQGTASRNGQIMINRGQRPAVLPR